MLFLRPRTPARDTEAGWRIHIEWLARDAAGTVVAQGAGDADALAGLADEPWAGDAEAIVLLVPIECVTWLTLSVPGRSSSQIRRALPFAAEEFLAQDIETMHLAHAPIARGRPVRCAAIDDALLSDWLACLRDAGLSPRHAVADASLLPGDAGGVSALFDGDDVVVRAPEHMARVDVRLLPEVLRAAFDGSVGADAAPLTLIGGTLADIDAPGLPPPAAEIALPDGPLAYLASRWPPQAAAIDLLQGAYQPARRRQPSAAGWRSVAALAALMGAIFIGGALAEGVWAERKAGALSAEAQALYQAIYPDERPARNVYAEMRRRIGQTGDDQAQFHLLLGGLAAGMGSGSGGAELKSLSFDEKRAQLATEVKLAGYADLDGLSERLEEQGLQVDIGSAEEREGQVHARLRLELAG